jgi:hypothetical protein
MTLLVLVPVAVVALSAFWTRGPRKPSARLVRFALLPVPLVETALGFLDLGDVRAARGTCLTWSRLRARCSRLRPRELSDDDLKLFWPELVREICIDCQAPGFLVREGFHRYLDLSVFRGLETLQLMEPSSKINFQVPAHTQVQVRLMALMAPSGIPIDLLHRLHSLECHCCCEGGHLLTTLLALPRLESLVLHGARTLTDTTVRPGCPLQSLVLVDCLASKLDFMDELAHIHSFGLVHESKLHLPCQPTHVPERTRARIKNLAVWRSCCGLDFSLAGYVNLSGLYISSLEESDSCIRSRTLGRELDQLQLRALILNISLSDLELFKGCLAGLDCLEVRGLHHDLSACASLQQLRIWSPTVKERTHIDNMQLPPALKVLEMDSASFALLKSAEKARLKAVVPSLFVSPRLRTPAWSDFDFLTHN